MNDDQLDALLSQLEDPAPPPELDARVLAAVHQATAGQAPATPSSRRWPMVLAAAAGLAAVLLLWPTGATEVIQTSGTQRYTGPVHVLVGDIEVDIDGQADVTVEPVGPPLRVDAAGGPMDKTHLLSALAGATVTIAVYQGTAAIHGGTDAHAHLAPGDLQQVVVGGDAVAAPVSEPARAPARPHPDSMSQDALRQELTELREQLAAAEASAEWQRGQLAQVEGEAVEWTDAAPAALRPDQFEATLKAALGSRDDVAILGIDCAEDPCLATIQVYGDDPDWDKGFDEISDAVEEASGAETFGAMHMAGRAETDDAPPVNVMTVGYLTQETPDALRRAQFRGQQMMHDTMADLAPEGADE